MTDPASATATRHSSARRVAIHRFYRNPPNHECDLGSLLTNGGFGGTQQAVAAGVPVVVAGETEDKPANAARVAHHGLGIDLQTATPTPEAVADAVARLLDDSEIHENLARLAKVYERHDALDAIERLPLG